jgi:hypothetical protein
VRLEEKEENNHDDDDDEEEDDDLQQYLKRKEARQYVQMLNFLFLGNYVLFKT